MLSKNNVIRAIACAIGVTAGSLTYLTSRSCSQAVLAAGAAVSGSSDLIRYLLAADPEHPATDRAAASPPPDGCHPSDSDWRAPEPVTADIENL